MQLAQVLFQNKVLIYSSYFELRSGKKCLKVTFIISTIDADVAGQVKGHTHTLSHTLFLWCFSFRSNKP